MNDISIFREKYADEIAEKIDDLSSSVKTAYAKVKKEDFLGPGPWKILDTSTFSYNQTTDDNPQYLYQDVLVAIDADRHLNNGHPSSLARWINSLKIDKGEKVLHIGCGLGYYTAIMAEIVGEAGEVTGLEVDPSIADRARENVESYRNIKIVKTDGTKFKTGLYDAIFVNAGATHPLPEWLDMLNSGGRLLLPITISVNESIGNGFTVLVTKLDDSYKAEVTGPVGIFHCLGARDEVTNEQLKEVMVKGPDFLKEINFLIREKHTKTSKCKIHTDLFCLSS